MRNAKAKAIRRQVYGDLSPRADARKYYRHKDRMQIIADKARRVYQAMKGRRQINVIENR